MNQDGIITKPINIETDLGYVLGTGSGDVGTNFQSAAVKPWAKFKGIASRFIGMTGKTSGSTYWQGADGKCGFSIQVFDAFGDFSSVADNFVKKLYAGQLDWVYVHPTGGAASPFRPLDFDGYDHNAISPLGDIGGTVLYLSLEDNVRVLHVDYDHIARNGDWLDMSDIEPDRENHPNVKLSAYYLGVFLYSQPKSRWYALTSTTPIGNTGGFSMSCEFPADDAGAWELVPFLSINQISVTSEQVANGSFLSFYDRKRIDVTIKLGSVTITPSAWWTGVDRKVAWEVVINNDDSTFKQFTGAAVVVCKTTDPEDNPASDGEQIGIFNQFSYFTVQGKTILRLSYEDFALITTEESQAAGNYYWVRFTCDQIGYVTNWVQFDEISTQSQQ